MYSLSASVAQVLLHRDEAGARVALVGDEEQAGVELVGDRIDAVGERVAAAEQADAVVLLGCGEPDVRVERDHRLAVVLRGEVDGVVLLASPPSGAPSCLSRPMVSSWSASVERSQTSSIMRMRRVTR